MRAFVAVVLALVVSAGSSHAQQKKPLATNGWGHLSGKVTLGAGVPIPEPVDLVPKMMQHVDKACCLDPKAKAIEKIDPTWIVDKKTRAVANVVVWVKAPAGAYFPIHDKYKKRTDHVVFDQPHCAYLPRISACNPVYFDGTGNVATGQTVTIKNSSTVPHNVLALGHPLKNKGFNETIPPGKQIVPGFEPQVLPISLSCNFHPWMSAKLFVFDHPYYAITKEDGSYEIPFVPAGAELSIMAWHEALGWALTNKGEPTKIKEGKNTFDFTVK